MGAQNQGSLSFVATCDKGCRAVWCEMVGSDTISCSSLDRRHSQPLCIDMHEQLTLLRSTWQLDS
jgi:hypothetical protein